VQDKTGTEEPILLTPTTVIRLDNKAQTAADLKTGQQVAVFGQPNNQGQIQAEFIRIFP
jgi:hypothetical protein